MGGAFRRRLRDRFSGTGEAAVLDAIDGPLGSRRSPARVARIEVFGATVRFRNLSPGDRAGASRFWSGRKCLVLA
jgi:hypothetical protein